MQVAIEEESSNKNDRRGMQRSDKIDKWKIIGEEIIRKWIYN